MSQIADISKGEGISKVQLSEKGKPCILYGELYTKYKSEIINEVFSKTNIDSSGLKRSKANDVIIPCSGETAIDIATARCVPFDNVLLGGDLNIIRLHQHNGSFMSYQLNGKRKYDIAKVAQGVSVVHLYGDHLNTIITYNPKINEQRKITKFLSLIDKRIATQSEIICKLQALIKSIRETIVDMLNCNWLTLKELVKNGAISLKRGQVIPKHEFDDEYCYPVYSSSVQQDGLMGYNNSYMFDKELISWSIDGGGNFFYRHPHKFNVTNVCGYIEMNANLFDARFVSEILKQQHSRMVFDYQTKAHPSVIESLYSLPLIDINQQRNYATVFDYLYKKLNVEQNLKNLLADQKKFLLQNMFI